MLGAAPRSSNHSDAFLYPIWHHLNRAHRGQNFLESLAEIFNLGYLGDISIFNRPTYRMSHRVPSTFKLVYGHLNNIFLTGIFAWAFPIHFANSGQKDFAKFQIFDPCTVCGKTLRDSGGGYLPAFWATLPYYLLFGPHPIITFIKN